MPRKIICFSPENLKEIITALGLPVFRSNQILEWVYKKNILSWDKMTNLSVDLRNVLCEKYYACSIELAEKAGSKRDSSEKFLFKTIDGKFIESVLIVSGKRRTLCLSTQIGCKYKCAFCASGAEGFERDLHTAEIVDQVRCVQHYTNERITNIVYMGMGEPLDNYKNTLDSLKIINAGWGFEIGARHLTISSAGLVPAIEKFSKEGFEQVRLSVSLHAVTQEKRLKIMPIAQKYSLKQLLAVLQKVSDIFKQPITLEYTILKGFNNSIDDADTLAKIAGRIGAKVNLIGYNVVDCADFELPAKNDMDRFKVLLEKRNIPVFVRYSAGDEISAACGQLRLKRSGKE